MKSSIAILIAFCLSTGAIWASDRQPAPGRIASDPGPTASAATDPTDNPDFFISSEEPNAEFDFRHNRPYTGEDAHDRLMNKLWVASLVTLVASNAADAASSWGRMEANPLLASSNGRFGAKALSIKFGLTAAVAIPEIIFRKHADLKRVFALGNFTDSAAFGAAAIHNFAIEH